jgi:hypothetical protein
MKQVFSKEGMRSLGAAWILLAVSIVASLGVVAAAQWYYEKEQRESATFGQRLQEARVRVQGARRERDSLQESSEVFRTLVERGMLQSEKRLDLVELVNALRARHQLSSLDYEVAPQRMLQLSGGRSFASIDVLASRVKLKARALHEADIIGFMDSLTRTPQGFYPVDRCVMRRVEATNPDSIQPRVEAECSLEWITLKEKRGAARPS